MFSKLIIVLIIVASFFTRFVKLDWGNGFYFQPDENNMALSLSQLSSSNLNPHFFAYGQFPLYLGYFTLNLLHLPNNFSNSILILRLYSAFFSLLSIYFIFLISKLVLAKKFSFWLLLLFIFNPGLIQLAHFGTTESLLVLVFLINIYLSFLIINNYKIRYLLIASLISGIGLATKISSLIFLFPITLSLLINLLRSKKFVSFFFSILIFSLSSCFWALLLSPYNLIESRDFLSSMSYETSVATGQTMVFYTTQFVNTIPYLFQIWHIFPYTLGLPVYLLSLISLVFLFKNWQLKQPQYHYWFLILSSCLVYFLYFGQLYVKWTRFMSPLFFLPPLLVAYFIGGTKSKLFQVFLIFICCIPGIVFTTNLYLSPDVRLQASKWLTATLDPGSYLLSEGGNVIDIPVGQHRLIVKNYDFYNYTPSTLAANILDSSYILIPSRRVYKNFNYPYYPHLFDGSLGFVPIKSFTPSADLFLNPENAEETWSVFDHPTIRLYQKTNQLDYSQYEKLL